MKSTGKIHAYTDNKTTNINAAKPINKHLQKRNSNSKIKKNTLPPPPRRHRLVQSSYRSYPSSSTNVSTSTTAVATAAAYAAYNRHNTNNTKSLIDKNNAVNIVAAAATGYGNNISSALKNNNPALKSLSLSNTSSLHIQSPSQSSKPKDSPKINTPLNENDEINEISDNNDINTSNTLIQNKENIKKNKLDSDPVTKHQNNIFSSSNSNNCRRNNGCSSNSKINYALKLLSDADHFKEDDLECISLRKEAVEILKDYHFDKSHVTQLYQIGLHYVYEKDYQKAYDIFKEAHEFHYPAATFQLARYYESGILPSIPKDNKIAQKYYRHAALNSYCKAMYRLSMAYLHGEIDCKKSKKESIRWLHRCTWSIDSKEQIVVGEAMYQLSKFYEKGMTTDKEKDQKSAASYLRMAAEKYCVDAQDYLGYCYQHGHLTYPRNMKKAVYWFTQAANGHCIEAKISLCHLYLAGSPPDIPQDDSEALYWIRRASNSTYVNNSTQRFSKAKAQYILGWLFEEGLENILEKNPKEAIKWYLKANFEGVPDAKSALKHFTQEEINEVIQEEKQNKPHHESENNCHGNQQEIDEFSKYEKVHEDESDYSSSELFDDNISNVSGRSSRSLNIKLINMASSLWNHHHMKKNHHHYSKSMSDTHKNVKKGETFTEEKSEDDSENCLIKVKDEEKKSEDISEDHSIKDEEKIIPQKLSNSSLVSHECQCSSEQIEKITNHNHNIHIEELNRKINEANKEENYSKSSGFESDGTLNNLRHQKSSNLSSEDLSKDTLVNDDLHQHPQGNNTISEREMQFIAKLNSDLIKSMMITKSEPNSPYVNSISTFSSNSSQYSGEHVHLNQNMRIMEYIGNESVYSSCSSYSSALSEECGSSTYCSTCCYSCSSYCPSSKISYNNKNINHHRPNQINSHFILQAPSSIASITSEECSSNNFDVMSQDSSVSSVASFDKHNIKAHLQSSQKFSGFDKSQITSSDRMRAYSHYKNAINNKIKQDKETNSINKENDTSITPRKIIRRHSHSGILHNSIKPLTPLNLDSTLNKDNSSLKQRSKSSVNIVEQFHDSLADEDAFRLHHIKGLSDTESEKSYVCPQTANIFETFEKREEHHDYGHNNERHYSKPKSVVKSCQYHHGRLHKHHSISLGHHHSHHHHHHHHHHHQNSDQKHNQKHNQKHEHHNQLHKFNLPHSLTFTSLPNKDFKSTDSFEFPKSNNKSKEEQNITEKQNMDNTFSNILNVENGIENKVNNEKKQKLFEIKDEKNETKEEKNKLVFPEEKEGKQHFLNTTEKTNNPNNIENKEIEKIKKANEMISESKEVKKEQASSSNIEQHHNSFRETIRISRIFTKSKEHLKIDLSKIKRENSQKSNNSSSENSNNHKSHHHFFNIPHTPHFHLHHSQEESKKGIKEEKKEISTEGHHSLLNKFNIFHFH